MKKKSIGLTILAVMLVLMALTRPNKNHFQNWLNYHLNKHESNVFETAVKKSLGRQANYHITYSDKILFSIVERRVGSGKMKFVGVFHTWLPI